VSDPVARDTSFTVRLSADEREQLDRLAARWQLDKSATLRRALQHAANERHLPQSGYFVTLPPAAVSFPVRLSRKVGDGR
jgi:hypothetical protein